MKGKEHNYLATHPEIFRKYRGEYIAVIGEKVVAHGTELDKVLDKAKKIEKLPLTMKIPREDVLVV